MPPVERKEMLSIPDDNTRNSSANSNSVGSPSFDRSGLSSDSTPSSRNSASPEESALFRMFHENSINIPNIYEPSSSNINYQRIVIPREQSLLDMLRLISNGEDVFMLKEVKLRVVASTISLSRIGLYCPRIKILKLDGSVLTSLRDIGTTLRHLKILHVSRCGLTSLDGTFGLTTLQELHANDNNISHMGPCAALQNIRVINIERNRILSLNTISFLSICPRLIELSLNGNPVCRQESYRESVTEILSCLRILDGRAMLQDKLESSEIEDMKSDTESLSSSIDVSSLTELNSDDYQEAEEIFARKCNQIKRKFEIFEDVSPKSRPATSSGIGNRRPFSQMIILPQRPNSANPRSHDLVDENSDATVFDEGMETTPSILTSGSIVCGSIGRALVRSRLTEKRLSNIESENINSPRKNSDSLWSLRNSQKNHEFLFCSLPTKLKIKKDVEIRNPRYEAVNKLLNEELPEKPTETAPVVELEFGVTGMACEEPSSSNNTSSPNDALKAAKMWRKAFKLYRSQNNINISQNNQNDPSSPDILVPNLSLAEQFNRITIADVEEAVAGSDFKLCESKPD